MRTPTEAIESLDGLQGTLGRRCRALDAEIDGITEQWDALGRHGGMRDDHAAQLLGRLRPHLEDIASFASLCVGQIDAMVRDPFGRNT
jgi:hypothetical protein